MPEFNNFMKNFTDFISNYWINIVIVLAVLIIGGILIKLLSKLLMKIIYGTKIDNASGSFVVALLRIVLWVILFFVCARILGIEGNSFLVAFSSVALAIGLALKDSLANIANGIVIVCVKPFKKGDHVQIGDVEGIIKKISILTTELKTFDNKRIVMPNSQVTSGSIVNFTANPTRRIDFTYSVSYNSDMKKVKEVLFKAVSDYQYTLKTQTIRVYMSAHSASSVDFKVVFWVNVEDYWTTYFDFNEVVWNAFLENKIEIPYNQLDVHIKDQPSK